MRERKPGWYWAQEHSFDDWMPQYWNGTDFGGMDEECFVEIGPRIPMPGEAPPIGTRYRDESGEMVAVVVPAELERLRATFRLTERFVNAKGRYHSQLAMCDLMEHFGKSCVRPESE